MVVPSSLNELPGIGSRWFLTTCYTYPIREALLKSILQNIPFGVCSFSEAFNQFIFCQAAPLSTISFKKVLSLLNLGFKHTVHTVALLQTFHTKLLPVFRLGNKKLSFLCPFNNNCVYLNDPFTKQPKM